MASLYEATVELCCPDIHDLNTAVQKLQAAGANNVRCEFKIGCIECNCWISTESLQLIKMIPCVKNVHISNPAADGDTD